MGEFGNPRNFAVDLVLHLWNTICGGIVMPTKNPRINVVCEQPLYYELSNIASAEGSSLSSVAHDLIKEALELREDRALATLADSRSKTFNRATALSLDQVFGE